LSQPAINAAITFEPEAYGGVEQIMGRRAAGAGYLRAAVEGRRGERLWSYTPYNASATAFAAALGKLDPTAEHGWLQPHRFDLLTGIGTLYFPGPDIARAANLRLRAGPAAYSLCGITHTLSTERVMTGITALLTAPVMPWDAVICTSSVAVDTLRTVAEAEAEYLGWRFGGAARITLPQFPVIPLGIHCSDFEFQAEDRITARADLGLAPDEVAVLFAGRLSLTAKAHPFAMFHGLQAVAQRTGKSIVLIQSGQFFNADVEAVYRSAVAQFCPDVRCLFIDGRDDKLYRAGWAGSDLFVSLSDNIQETFGLTPLEAMASGLPVVVTDWNGYKDTVRDGVDGFRIRTWAPQAGIGANMARDYQSGALNFDHFLARASMAVTVDMAELVDRLSDLVQDPDLRRRQGQAGQARTRALYDWAVVYRQYQDLWAELSAQRLSAGAADLAWSATAPRQGAAHLDPFQSFSTYPTAMVAPATRVSLIPGATPELYAERAGHALFSKWRMPPDLVAQMLDYVSEAEISVEAVGRKFGMGPVDTVVGLSILAKMDLVRFGTD
jgi:starch synthase